MTLQGALERFQDALVQVEQHAKLASIIGKLRSHGLVTVDGDEQRQAVATTFYELSKFDGSLSLPLLYVSICFAYEEFVRNVFRVIVQAHDGLVSGQLGEALKG